MPSPFPGMNPYLEQTSVWHDFHERLLPAAAEMIGALIVPRYFVKIDEHLYIHELPEENRRLIGRADLLVASLAPDQRGVARATRELLAPAEVTALHVDTLRDSFLEIRDRDSRQVVTIVELLSPSNKYAGPDRDLYVNKVRQAVASNINVVEIDLLRGGPRMPWQGIPETCAYCVVVYRPENWPKAGLWPIGLRDPLPEIPVPLRSGEAHARLDLQQLLHRVYDAAGYAYYIYTGRPDPALAKDDAEWAQAFVPPMPPA